MGHLAWVWTCLALLAAGCATPGATTPPDDGALVEQLSFDGRIERLVCVVGPAGPNCHVDQDARDFELAPGPVQRIRATFTWTPTGPVDAELQAYLLATDEQGDWQWEESPDTFARGPPPLAIDWDATRVAFPYHHLSLHLASAHRASTDAGRVVAGSGVSWHVDAEIERGPGAP